MPIKLPLPIKLKFDLTSHITLVSFLSRYFRSKADKKKAEKPESDDEDSDASSIGDDEFDKFLDKHGENIEGDGPGFSDDDFDFAG